MPLHRTLLKSQPAFVDCASRAIRKYLISANRKTLCLVIVTLKLKKESKTEH